MRPFILSLIFILSITLSAFAKEPIRTIEGTVTKVSDGDTIHVVDSLGTKVKGKLQRQHVRLDVMDTDRYGRTVSIVWLGDRNINLEMVAEGWAWAYTQYLDRPHASEYLQAEEQARAKRLGLWQQNNPQPPWELPCHLARLNQWTEGP